MSFCIEFYIKFNPNVCQKSEEFWMSTRIDLPIDCVSKVVQNKTYKSYFKNETDEEIVFFNNLCFLTRENNWLKIKNFFLPRNGIVYSNGVGWNLYFSLLFNWRQRYVFNCIPYSGISIWHSACSFAERWVSHFVQYMPSLFIHQNCET